jgi:putative tricarboxylic transport membrane protein
MIDTGRLGSAAVMLPVFLLVLTTIYLAEALNIGTQFGGEDAAVGPRFMPILTACLMYVALIVVLVGELRSAQPERSTGSLVRPALVVVATAVYIPAFLPLGYILSTGLFVAALFLIFDFERRRPLLFALYLAGVVAVFYGLFGGIFGVRLPLLPGTY